MNPVFRKLKFQRGVSTLTAAGAIIAVGLAVVAVYMFTQGAWNAHMEAWQEGIVISEGDPFLPAPPGVNPPTCDPGQWVSGACGGSSGCTRCAVGERCWQTDNPQCVLEQCRVDDTCCSDFEPFCDLSSDTSCCGAFVSGFTPYGNYPSAGGDSCQDGEASGWYQCGTTVFQECQGAKACEFKCTGGNRVTGSTTCKETDPGAPGGEYDTLRLKPSSGQNEPWKFVPSPHTINDCSSPHDPDKGYNKKCERYCDSGKYYDKDLDKCVKPKCGNYSIEPTEVCEKFDPKLTNNAYGGRTWACKRMQPPGQKGGAPLGGGICEYPKGGVAGVWWHQQLCKENCTAIGFEYNMLGLWGDTDKCTQWPCNRGQGVDPSPYFRAWGNQDFQHVQCRAGKVFEYIKSGGCERNNPNAVCANTTGPNPGGGEGSSHCWSFCTKNNDGNHSSFAFVCRDPRPLQCWMIPHHASVQGCEQLYDDPNYPPGQSEYQVLSIPWMPDLEGGTLSMCCTKASRSTVNLKAGKGCFAQTVKKGDPYPKTCDQEVSGTRSWFQFTTASASGGWSDYKMRICCDKAKILDDPDMPTSIDVLSQFSWTFPLQDCSSIPNAKMWFRYSDRNALSAWGDASNTFCYTP